MKMTLSTFPFSDSLEFFGDWIQLYYITCLAIILNLLGYVAGLLTAAPPTCPSDTFTFRCNVTGDRNGITIWRVGGSECTLPHTTSGASSTCGPGRVFTAEGLTGFGTNATSFSSTLSSTATSTLDGTLVECFGPALSRDAENRVGGSSLQISGQYYAALHN